MRLFLVCALLCALASSASAQESIDYRVVATNRTSTMQKEMQEADDAGFVYVGQTVFESVFGGKEVASIFERNVDSPSKEKYEYQLLATNKTSTMQKELQQAGQAGFQMIGMTVGKTLVGGNEVVSILRRPVS